MPFIDLHTHTNASDGLLTPVELVNLAKEKGLLAIAITDHDSISGVKTVVNSSLIEVISGIEISTSNIDGKEVHLLGYFVDVNNHDLNNSLSELIKSRANRAYEIVGQLERIGLVFDKKELFNHDNVSRVHIADQIIKQGKANCYQEVFDNYLNKGAPGYVAKKELNYKDSIDLIINAGGLPVLAHPGLTLADDLITNLDYARSIGIKGIEVLHPDNNRPVRSILTAYCNKHDLLITGGSDFHGKDKLTKLGPEIEKIDYSYLQQLKDFLN